MTLRLLLLIVLWSQISPGAVAQSFSWLDTYGKSPTEFSPEEWAPIIDQAFGPGKAASSQLRVWDTWWNDINLKFGGFHDIDIDMLGLRSRYRPEVQAGVSRGRLSGIMTHFTYGLQELHTYLWDNGVRNTPLTKGVPMMVIGQFGPNSHFGAAITPLPDSSLVVYEVAPGHPLGLEPGDLILGYDGVAWDTIYPRLLAAEIPLFLNPVHGNTPEANHYYAMHAAGLNWHLFDSIDVVKYATGDTLHLPTDLMSGYSATVWGKDQIAPAGVPWPDRSAGDRVGWGVIDGTNVGMVTVTSWSFDAQFDIRNRFEAAVDGLMHTHEVDGMIFDFRFNTGGGALAREGLQLLFNEVTPTVGFDRRVVGTDWYAMEPDPARREANLVIQGDPATYFDAPIAILVGPGAISAGELEARRMSFHPRARVFGLPAPSGNTGSDFISIGDPDWFVSRTNSTQYLADNHEYITRKPLTPDVRVWFTRDDVARGVDTVIQTALAWIESDNTGVGASGELPGPGRLEAFPNPSSGPVSLVLQLDRSEYVSAEVVDILGRRVWAIHDGALSTGRTTWTWEADVTPGLYLWRVRTSAGVQTAPVLVLE